MEVKIKSKSVEIHIEAGEYNFSQHMLYLYDNFNQEKFDSKLCTLSALVDYSNAVYDIHSQERPEYVVNDKSLFDNKLYDFTLNLDNKKDVLLGFSGGLDSCYLAIHLKEQGYNVHLFHAKNLNSYECGLSYTVAKSFANRLGFDFIEATFSKTNSTDNKYKQYWKDNTSKNQLICSIMIDICSTRGWNIVSLGDDRSMYKNRPDMILGINSTDCREVQDTFESCVKRIFSNIKFLTIDRELNSNENNKYERLKKLDEYKALDLYYSCVGSGRFNQYNHSLNEKKFGVLLPKYNCGCSCTKCALHNLLLFYGGKITYPKAFIEKCWNRLCDTKYGTIQALFSPNIPLNERIDNLFKY